MQCAYARKKGRSYNKKMIVSKNAKIQRQENIYLILKVIRRHQGVSRKKIAQITGLSLPSVTQIVDRLQNLNLLRYDMRISKNGKKIPFYHYHGGNYTVLGLEFRRKTVLGLACDLEGHIINQFSFAYTDSTLDCLLDRISHHLQRLIQESNQANSKVLGLGIGIPGLLDYKERTIIIATDFHHWSGTAMGKEIEDRLSIPVVLEKNPTLSAYAESRVGIGKGKRSLIYVGMGVGIGAGIIYNHKIFRGGSSLYCELGHTTVDINGAVCECGNRGCLELYLKDAVLKEKMKHARMDYEQEALLKEAADYAAAAIGNIVGLVGIRTVILGGTLIQDYPSLFDHLVELIPQRTLSFFKSQLEVLKSTMKEGSAALGGALLMAETALKLNTLFFEGTPRNEPLRFEAVI